MAINVPNPEPQVEHPTQLPIGKLRHASAVLFRAEKIWQDYIAGIQLELETDQDRDQHAIVAVVRLDSPPPIDELNELLRNCVNEGRSALDNLITRIAREHGATEKQLTLTAFPVAKTDAEWRKSAVRLGCVSEDTRARVRNVQPFTSHEQPGPPHPLAMLHDLWNADKHRGSFSAAIGFSPQASQFQLATWTLTVNNEQLDTFLQQTSDVDRTVDLDLGPIRDGTRLLVMRVPQEICIDQLEVDFLDARFTLGLIGPGVSITDSAIAMLRNALRFAREAVRYVAGGVDELPVVFPPGLVERHVEPV